MNRSAKAHRLMKPSNRTFFRISFLFVVEVFSFPLELSVCWWIQPLNRQFVCLPVSGISTAPVFH